MLWETKRLLSSGMKVGNSLRIHRNDSSSRERHNKTPPVSQGRAHVATALERDEGIGCEAGLV